MLRKATDVKRIPAVVSREQESAYDLVDVKVRCLGCGLVQYLLEQVFHPCACSEDTETVVTIIRG